MLPDDVLLEIFDLCLDQNQFTEPKIEAWQLLVHVCRRWRSVVFGSPRRLDLHLDCTDKKPVREMLDVWPPLLLEIQNVDGLENLKEGVNNIVAALEHRDRVSRINFYDVNRSPWRKILAKMQGPFPELKFLMLGLTLSSTFGAQPFPVLPDSFLRGSVPLLQRLYLSRIPFPGLPNLLLSTTHLVNLSLLRIPDSGYISPDTMATALSALASLELLRLEFESSRSRPNPESRCPPPPTRRVLPILTFFSFTGAYEYLDDLVARIDAPRLKNLSTTIFNDIVLVTLQFIRFISRTLTLKLLEIVHVVFESFSATIHFLSQPSGYGSLQVNICGFMMDRQASSLKQVCTSCLPLLGTAKDLYIYRHRLSPPRWEVNIENMVWLEILWAFPAVENLYLSQEFAPRIVTALEELAGGRTTDVLPTLQNIFLERTEPAGHFQEDIGRLVAAQQLSSHTIPFPTG